MSELPKELTIPTDPEEAEDFHELLELIISQNSEILERMDAHLNTNDCEDCADYDDDEAPVTGAAAFWAGVFSFWGLLIVIVICTTLTQIFAGSPIFK